MEACDPLEQVNVYRRLPQQGTCLKALVYVCQYGALRCSTSHAGASLQDLKNGWSHYARQIKYRGNMEGAVF